MAQNLPEIGRLPNLGVKMDKNVKDREPPSETGRVGISVIYVKMLSFYTEMISASFL